jgi:hypothetical protein
LRNWYDVPTYTLDINTAKMALWSVGCIAIGPRLRIERQSSMIENESADRSMHARTGELGKRGDGLKFSSERPGEFRLGYLEEEEAGGFRSGSTRTPNLTPRHRQRSVQICA